MRQFDAAKVYAPAAGVGPEGEAVLDGFLDGLRNSFAVERDRDLAIRFLRAAAPPGKFWLYGAGTHTRMIISELSYDWNGRILGVIDRNPSGRSTFLDLPLVPFVGFVAGPNDSIIVAHPFFESAMANALISAGVRSDQVITLYENPAFIAFCRRERRPFKKLARCEALIVGTTSEVTVSDASLATILNPETTPYLAFDLFEAPRPRPPFRVVDLRQSVDNLEAALKTMAPRLVYLRSKMETNFLAPLIQRILPDAVIVHEVWDFALIFEDESLRDWLQFPVPWIETARLAECWSVRHCPLVISKRGGGAWSDLCHGSSPSELVFGGIGAVPPQNSEKRADEISILYAGALPKPDQLDAMPLDYNFIDRLIKISAAGLAKVTILNSSHQNASADQYFAWYLDEFAKAGISYQRRVPYEEFMRQARQHDFGWLALRARTDWGLGKDWTIPMRFTSYVEAGLPIIVSHPWSECVRLVEEFNSGIVVDDDDDKLIQLLESSNVSALKQGVKNLHQYMATHNETVLGKLGELLGEPA